MSFLRYPHLEKWGNEEVADIEHGVVHIFPKLDGTNASVWWDKGICAGSRNRQLDTKTLQSDNAGFAAYCVSGMPAAVAAGEFLQNNNTLVLYGEWLVPHTIQHYRKDAWRKFYIFDVYDRETDRFLSYEEYHPLMLQYQLDFVPCVKTIKNASYENLLHEAKTCRYLLEDNNVPGEGIVIKNYEWKNKYNRVTWAKIINSEFKDNFHAAMGPNILENVTNAQKICDLACTEALVRKEHAKIVLENQGWDRRYIPRLLHSVYYSVVTEELWSCLKKIGRGSVNFQELESHCTRKVKTVMQELF